MNRARTRWRGHRTGTALAAEVPAKRNINRGEQGSSATIQEPRISKRRRCLVAPVHAAAGSSEASERQPVVEGSEAR